jgi:hypothetical protein
MTESTVAGQPAVPAVDFERDVAPIFLRHCAGCHNPSDKAGGLSLMSRDGAYAAGKSGEPAVKPGDIDDSYIITRIDAGEMPPAGKGKPLAGAELATLKRWIESGALWPKDRVLSPLELTTATRAGRDWWCLKPLGNPRPPTVKRTAWMRNPIDAFVLEKLEEKQLAPAPPADKRTLLRRVTFDLIGLPPTPSEISAFLADGSPEAYEHVVDRLLASPHYGERWARHWLDVVHFGESQGFERDKPRPGAYRYRDWVIAAFNEDLPYDEFVRLQLAGDVLRPDDPEAVDATGYLVAGPWDEVGETQQSAAMKAVVREDSLEDLVGTTSQTFLGLTANCARCHDHKFDPISQLDYYRLRSALSGVRHGERESLAAAGKAAADARRQALDGEASELERKLAALEEPVRRRLAADSGASPHIVLPKPIARWEFKASLRDALGDLHGEPHGHARLADGRLRLDGRDSYVATVPLNKPLAAKTLEVWVALDNLQQRGGAAMSLQTLDGGVFDAIVFGELEPGHWMAGSNGFTRYRSFSAEAETAGKDQFVQITIAYGSDRTITAYRNGRPYGTTYTASSLNKFPAGGAQLVFGLRHLPVGGNKMLAGSIERAQLYDRALTPEEVAASAGVPAPVSLETVLAALTPDESRERQRLVTQLSWVRLRQGLLSGGPAYAVNPQLPAPTHVLARGNPAQPGVLVAPGGIAAAAPGGADLGLAADAPDAARREKLASWITGPAAPLAARVMANRLWHYHFGVGIVDTPNDFGFNGGRPSHPELLDWLARQLLDGHWSVKRLQRTIVLSATYRQSDRVPPEVLERGRKIDADDRLLWRKAPQRLDAESIRDAMLATAGQLNPSVGGPSYRDHTSHESNSTFYEPIDPVGYEFNRRTIYRMWIRSGTNHLLDVFDCPDPSTTTPKRLTTTTPLQALGLWNNALVLRLSDRFAERLHREAGSAEKAQIELAYELVFARAPEQDELSAAIGFVHVHGLAAFCRVLFNSDEFLYVD